jgi:penicillin-binding protein 1A
MLHFAAKVKALFKNNTRKKLYFWTGLILFSILIASSVARYILKDLPTIDNLDEYTPSLTTRVFDRNGEFIAQFALEQRAFLALDKIPKALQNAVIAMEDEKFFDHWGISFKGILRALLRDLSRKKAAQGGSTITQQLSKLLFLTPEKTITRKIREILIALQIEHRFSKPEILQLYLNEIYFGLGAYGVKSAAKRYFGKKVEDLTIAECALLAGVIPLPARYSPFTHPERSLWRRNIVINRMHKSGFITKEEKNKALEEILPEKKPDIHQTQAPYFVEYVRKILEPKYGFNTLWRGGLEIHTTLDWKAQIASEEIMDKALGKIDEEVNRKLIEKYKDNPQLDEDGSPIPVEDLKEYKKLQGAFLAMDAATGEIRIMIGGRNYTKTKFNRAVQAKRQPGSAFKPFVWISALLNGYTAASIVEDMAKTYYFDGKNWRLFEEDSADFAMKLANANFVEEKDFDIWVPKNYDNVSMGKITLRKGLEKSRNLVAINLIDKLGPTVVVSAAKKAGITQHLIPNLSLALGSCGIPLLEMVNSFATFANRGIKVEPFAIRKVIDSRGRLLEENHPVEEEVFSPQHSYLLINMMKGVVRRGTAMGARALGIPLAGKTGTSQDHRDLWFMGMTPDVSAGAWMGYDDFSTIESKDWTGGATVVPWWTQIMKEVVKEMPVKDFKVPPGITFVTIDQNTGKLAFPTSRNKFQEAFLQGTEPKTFSSYHR